MQLSFAKLERSIDLAAESIVKAVAVESESVQPKLVHSRPGLESAQFAFSSEKKRPAVYASDLSKKQESDSDSMSKAETILHGVEATNELEDPEWNVVKNHKKQPVSLQGAQVLSSTVSDCFSYMPGGGGRPGTVVPKTTLCRRGPRPRPSGAGGGPCLNEVCIFGASRSLQKTYTMATSELWTLGDVSEILNVVSSSTPLSRCK